LAWSNSASGKGSDVFGGGVSSGVFESAAVAVADGGAELSDGAVLGVFFLAWLVVGHQIFHPVGHFIDLIEQFVDVDILNRREFGIWLVL
jgi:hypothetical protein